jgi:hypothetical protein
MTWQALYVSPYELERTELQYAAAEHQRVAHVLTAELAAAEDSAEAAHGMAERR